jgi:hypothetical protein
MLLLEGYTVSFFKTGHRVLRANFSTPLDQRLDANYAPEDN